MDDHPRLAHANVAQLTPLYVVDPAVLLHEERLLLRPGGPEVLSAALASLRSQLRTLGSDLVVRCGPTESILRQLASETGALPPTPVPHGAGDAAATGLEDAVVMEASSSQGSPAAAAVWDESRFIMNFRQWALRKGQAATAVAAPTSLPPLPPSLSLAPGDIPTPDQLRELLGQQRIEEGDTQGPETFSNLQRSIEGATAGSPEARFVSDIASICLDPLDVLDAYLSSAEAKATRSAQEGLPLPVMLRHQVAAAAAALELPSSPGSSFKAVVGPWLECGAISPRRVLERASRSGVISARCGGIPTWFSTSVIRDRRGWHPGVHRCAGQDHPVLYSPCLAGRQLPGEPWRRRSSIAFWRLSGPLLGGPPRSPCPPLFRGPEHPPPAIPPCLGLRWCNSSAGEGSLPVGVC